MEAKVPAHRRTVAQVLAVLTALDPYGLEPGTPDGAPANEYDIEAVGIARILLREGAVSVYDVEGVWMRHFSESLVLRIGVPRMAQLLDQLNDTGSSAR
jgi:hypothetical protein